LLGRMGNGHFRDFDLGLQLPLVPGFFPGVGS
jgi:hypothetical protein